MADKIRKVLGLCEILVGVFVIACGGGIAMEYFQFHDMHWTIAIKAPVWITLGFLFGFMGWVQLHHDDRPQK